ncbi:hypothetical protein B0A54_00896 [Friedmanniomyces endolithicus]|uniref:Uncharacterized protein n=1 Tax=Friedmanniomyces endolithicus TaxID=329885 RepID=A0A4U0VHR7_9PEZI|nr:hypothetical protein B0A54_00896 [Friedmanniomyces endolithicus]
MPLVVPGLSSTGSEDKTSGWMNKLAGKTLGDSSNETTELPKEHRVVKEGDMVSLDHKPERTNIHTADDGTVTKVTHG